ncbi:hypothetical protein IGI37_000272 [Enterococcus sp. AZ194]|uniref:hypothetical protein n=1 Tax=Enterococcus sp. AZ194 TaxID=2774629 RepID=UPI003F257402
MKQEIFIQETKKYALMIVLDYFLGESEKETSESFLYDSLEIFDISVSMFDKWKRGDAFPNDNSMKILEREIPNFKDKYNKVVEFLRSSDEWKKRLEAEEVEEWKSTFEGTWMESFSSTTEFQEYIAQSKKEQSDKLIQQKKEVRDFNKENIEIINKNKNNYDFQKRVNEYLKSK